MPSFKNPSFQDRVASAEKAKQKALDRLKAKPSVDAAIMAQRRDAWAAEEKTRSAKSAAKAEARATAQAEKASEKAARTAEAQEAAELKAARLKPPARRT